MAGKFKFSFGPWNIHEGADPFGPAVRRSVAFDKKLALYKKLGFDGVQFHDDNAVPGMNKISPQQIIREVGKVRAKLESRGLVAEFVAPRLWEEPRTIDGAYTSNDPACRKYAIERSKRCIDIANALGTKLIVLWLARALVAAGYNNYFGLEYQPITDAVGELTRVIKEYRSYGRCIG